MNRSPNPAGFRLPLTGPLRMLAACALLTASAAAAAQPAPGAPVGAPPGTVAPADLSSVEEAARMLRLKSNAQNSVPGAPQPPVPGGPQRPPRDNAALKAALKSLQVPGAPVPQAPPQRGTTRPTPSKPEEQEFTLWPGETLDVLGVRVTWETATSATASQSPTTATVIRFQGKESAFDSLLTPEAIVRLGDNWGIYLDEVLIYYRPILVSGAFQQFRIVARTQPSEIPVTAEPFHMKEGVALSSFQPVRLGPWALSLGSLSKRYPDGSEYLEIRARNQATSEDVTLPAGPDAFRTLGRFKIGIGDRWAENRTVLLTVEGDADRSPLGLDSLVDLTPTFGAPTTVREFLDPLGVKYGFRIEYQDGGSSASEAVFNTTGPRQAAPVRSDALLLPHLQSVLNGLVEIEAVSPQLARVRPTGKALARAEEEGRREAELKRFQAVFSERYSLATEIYDLETLAPETAEALIRKELGIWVLIRGDLAVAPDLNMREELDGDHYEIAWLRPSLDASFSAGALAKSEETVVADKGAGVLIVSAAPSTHDRIKQTLSKLEGALSRKLAADVPKRPRQFRVEAVLLQGGKAGQDAMQPPGESAPVISEPTVFDPALPARYGIGPEDLKMFGFDAAAEIGKGLSTVAAEAGEIGKSSTRLTDQYTADLSYRDFRDPYLVLHVRLHTGASDKSKDGGIIENTVFLEPGKPAVLGVTNLKEALILVLKLHGE